MESLLKTPADWLKLCLSFTSTKSRIAQYFYAIRAAANKKKWHDIYPKIARIAHYAKCSERSVQMFLSDMKAFGLEVIPRFDESGRQTSNIFRFDNNFFKAMTAIDRRHAFNANDDLKKELIEKAKSLEKPASTQWISPSPLPQFHPYSSSSSSTHVGVLLRGELKTGFYPCLQDIDIPLEAKIGLSGYPERSIVMAIEDLELFKKQKCKPDCELLFLSAQAGKHSGTRPQTRKMKC
jgi:hypothetical protein